MFFYVNFRCSCSYWSKLLHCSLENTCTVEIKLQKHFVIAKGLQKQSKQCWPSILLDDVIKLWTPKWYIEIWATWDRRSLWCSRDLLAACTTELYTHSAELRVESWVESGCISMYSSLFSWVALERPLLPSTEGWMNNQRSCDKVLALPCLSPFWYNYGDGRPTHDPTPRRCSSSGLSPKTIPTWLNPPRS